VLFLAVAFVSADPLPAVTPRLISSPQSCRAWPVNPFQIVVDSAEDPAVNSLPAQPYDIVFPSKVLPLLAIDLRASRRFAKVLYSCNAGRPIMRSGVGERLDICQDISCSMLPRRKFWFLSYTSTLLMARLFLVGILVSKAKRPGAFDIRPRVAVRMGRFRKGITMKLSFWACRRANTILSDMKLSSKDS
jgi:hypothetical protein